MTWWLKWNRKSTVDIFTLVWQLLMDPRAYSRYGERPTTWKPQVVGTAYWQLKTPKLLLINSFGFWPILKSSQISRGCGGRKRHRLLLLQGESTVCIHYLKSPQARREQAPWLLCWFESEMFPTGSLLGHLCYLGNVESLEMGAWLLKVLSVHPWPLVHASLSAF